MLQAVITPVQPMVDLLPLFSPPSPDAYQGVAEYSGGEEQDMDFMLGDAILGLQPTATSPSAFHGRMAGLPHGDGNHVGHVQIPDLPPPPPRTEVTAVPQTPPPQPAAVLQRRMMAEHSVLKQARRDLKGNIGETRKQLIADNMYALDPLAAAEAGIPAPKAVHPDAQQAVQREKKAFVNQWFYEQKKQVHVGLLKVQAVCILASCLSFMRSGKTQGGNTIRVYGPMFEWMTEEDVAKLEAVLTACAENLDHLPCIGHQRGAAAAGVGAAAQGHQPPVAVAAGLAPPPPGVVPPAVLLPPQGHQRGAAAAGVGAAAQGHQPPVAVAAGLAPPPPGVVPPAVLLPPQGHQRGAAAAGVGAAAQGHQPPVAVAAGLAPPPPGVVPPAVLLPPQGHQRGAAAAGVGAAAQGHQPPVAVAAGLAPPPLGVVPPAVLLPPQGHQRGAAAAAAAAVAAVVPPPLPSRTGAGGAALAAAAPPLPPGAARAGVIPVTPVTPSGAGTVKQSFKKGEKKLCVSWLLSYIEEDREGAQLDLAVQALRSDEGLRVEGKLQDLSDEMLTAAWKMAATQAGIEHGIPRKRQVPRVRAGTNTAHGGGLEPAPNTEPAVRNEGPAAHMSWHLLVSQLESKLSATVFDAVELDRLYNELHTCPERVSNRQAVLDEMHGRIAHRVDEN
ncbi:hypothetical protein PLESTM_001078700 [Pleodorina starrii]|nr:hypothetical protein PLESTM_001078700 [Pleodorina starrii]